MAFTIKSRQLQKVGRYTKELIQINITNNSNTVLPLDTHVGVPLFVTFLYSLDHAAQFLLMSSAIANNQVTVSNRTGVFLNGATIVAEVTGY